MKADLLFFAMISDKWYIDDHKEGESLPKSTPFWKSCPLFQTYY